MKSRKILQPVLRLQKVAKWVTSCKASFNAVAKGRKSVANDENGKKYFILFYNSVLNIIH